MVPLLLTRLEDLDCVRGGIRVPYLINEIDGLLAYTSVCVSGSQDYSLEEGRKCLHHSLIVQALLEEDIGGLHANQVYLNIVLLKAVHQDDRARLEEVFVFLHYATGNGLEHLMHGVQSELPLLPLLVLTLLHYDRFIPIERLLGSSGIDFNAIERTLTEVDDVDRLASGEHLRKGVSTPTRHIHLLIVRLFA